MARCSRESEDFTVLLIPGEHVIINEGALPQGHIIFVRDCRVCRYHPLAGDANVSIVVSSRLSVSALDRYNTRIRDRS